jgi:hypothetical protein
MKRAELSRFLNKSLPIQEAVVLGSHGPFTAFIPGNDAMAQADSIPFEAWRGRFWHYFARGVYFPEDLHDGQVLKTMDGGKLAVTRKDGALFVDGVRISDPIHTGNGPLYVLAKMLPSGEAHAK